LLISVENWPRDLRRELTRVDDGGGGQPVVKLGVFSFAGLAAFAELLLKRKLSFPVSTAAASFI